MTSPGYATLNKINSGRAPRNRPPNGLRLSGARKGVRCSRGLGRLLLLTVPATRTTPLPALPERPRQNYICAERDKKRRERRYDRPDPEGEKQELSVLVGRYGRQ